MKFPADLEKNKRERDFFMKTMTEQNESMTILLTGSMIQNHPGLLSTGVQAMRERLSDYLCAISLWLEQPEIDHVVYCDASKRKIPEEIFESPKFESLAVDLKEICLHRGKGMGEAKSMEYAMNNSRFLGRNFFKCTGRLFVKNFSEILQTITPMQPYFYLRKDHKIQWVDTRFFWMNRDAYETAVKPFLEKLNDFEGRIAEFIYYYHAQEYWEFPQPIFVGRIGHSGQIYDEDYSREMRDHAARLMEKIKISAWME
jgi:hypothetical protein